jgi:ribosomal protein S18 acetylase RimI-like enzyme
MPVEIRPTTLADAPAVCALHRATAAAPGGLAREPDEIGLGWIEQVLSQALRGGVAIGAWDGGDLVAELHAPRMGPRQFAHVLSDLTIAVHPDRQGEGLGARLFEALFAEAARLKPKVERIELMVREGNAGAIRLYERMGFVVDGRFEGRVRLPDGALEADLAMGKMLTA